MPSADNNDSYPYSFDDQPPPQQRKNREEDESLTEDILDEIDSGFDVSSRFFGCGWSLVTLPFRIIGKIIGFIGDLFD